ncbi:MAG: hypothetical protein L6V35_06920 [Alistipes putredinis]|nr:MAG: hypothetical protein L6V35_06920 [Alistipes putredinis]
MDSVGTLLMRYFTGIIAESLILTTFVSVVLLIFGSAAREALFIGMFVGLLNVIPYVGPLIAFCVSIIIAMLSPIAGFTFFRNHFSWSARRSLTAQAHRQHAVAAAALFQSRQRRIRWRYSSSFSLPAMSAE